MKIATLQYNIIWEDTSANLEKLSGLVDTLNTDVDLLVLPEMFTTGFSMNSKAIASNGGGEALAWMKQVAQSKSMTITGSVAVKENNQFYNRLYWVQPDGAIHHYDKRHLFRMAEEHHHYTGGKNQVVVDYKGVRFMLQICYDLRFPVWSRNHEELDYDVLLYVANWPEARSEAWYALLKARAIENLSYVIGVNRVGKDGNDISYDGKSAVFDFKGQAIDSHEDHVEGFSIQTLNLQTLKEFRQKFPAHLDADSFSIH
ncbi:amidohydrolase [Parvicella tangerina]|uniref:Omega-amidase YafV n=1 Tax=Parvicella tangerina TaxID=2829795 RepID=A0A916JJV3_9FLAO|nr:amidohydrolase [Parvicella tangerina]CAG5077965.1 Omega-amidase YafV [Parvicella tangerina]